jgi:acyl carrier protein
VGLVGTFDVVLAANVFHATGDLDRTLAHALALLAPGGILVLLEATHHPCWFDITIGLIEGWQAFDDPWRGDHPLLTAERWRAALDAAGFADVLALPEQDAPTAILGQHVIIARAPGTPRTSTHGNTLSDDAATTSPATHVETPVADEPPQIVSQLREALPGERHDLLAGLVREQVAQVLRAGPGNTLPHDEPLQELGFDSLMTVELRDRLGRALPLAARLPATLVFEYPTIAALARHLEQLLPWPEAEPQHAAPTPATTAPPTSVGDSLATLSEEDVERLLLAKLDGLTIAVPGR